MPQCYVYEYIVRIVCNCTTQHWRYASTRKSFNGCPAQQPLGCSVWSVHWHVPELWTGSVAKPQTVPIGQNDGRSVWTANQWPRRHCDFFKASFISLLPILCFPSSKSLSFWSALAEGSPRRHLSQWSGLCFSARYTDAPANTAISYRTVLPHPPSVTSAWRPARRCRRVFNTETVVLIVVIVLSTYLRMSPTPDTARRSDVDSYGRCEKLFRQKYSCSSWLFVVAHYYE